MAQRDLAEHGEQQLTLLPLRGLVAFPGVPLTLHVGRPKSLAALARAQQEQGRLVVAAQQDADLDDPRWEDVHPVGTLVEITEMEPGVAGGPARVVLQPLQRVAIEGGAADQDCLVAVVTLIPSTPAEPGEGAAYRREIANLCMDWLNRGGRTRPDFAALVNSTADLGLLCDLAAAHLFSRWEDRQEVLAAGDEGTRAQIVCRVLTGELNLLQLQRKLQDEVQQRMNEAQKEYYLREQLRAIRKELGEEAHDEVEELRQRLAAADVPPKVYQQVRREIDRLAAVPFGTPEGALIRNYVDWLLALPWQDASQAPVDLTAAAGVLAGGHYGLQQVKDRIIEYEAARRLVPGLQGPILCLVGPPGVGKTSLAYSVAEALRRPFVRISLGGVNDEAEIRGHRRTYVGALPGRIIQGMRRAGAKNPVMLLDEIDKMGRDGRGDPGAALLEVLDPQHNHEFSDHFIELPFDLSQVFFIATANVLHTIPAALRDRLEVIELEGYSDEEKMTIAQQHLLPRQQRRHGLTARQLHVTPGALRRLIQRYTREAGVRQLDRALGALCRKAARLVVTGENGGLRVTAANLHKYMGPPTGQAPAGAAEPQVGVVTALAWTPAGGDLLEIEAAVLPGTGRLILTGHMGDIMQESAQAAYTYVRSRCRRLGIDPDFHGSVDVHIHLSQGAVPKDGPSAGLAMAAAMASALTGRPVRAGVAMTGEITIRGRILPVGAVKEKVLAAHRAGLRQVFLPREEPDRRDALPSFVRQQLTMVPVTHADEVLGEVLLPVATDTAARQAGPLPYTGAAQPAVQRPQAPAYALTSPTNSSQEEGSRP